jgi:hypothetical protein
MHGDIKLGRWLPFTAEQVINADRGFIWSAVVRFLGVPIFRGFDRLLDGSGEMHWTLFGIAPMIVASGPDLTRAALGRVEIESLWLPSVLVRADVQWTTRAAGCPSATLSPGSQPLAFKIDEQGRLQSAAIRRWGNPGGGSFRFEDFGAVVEAEGAFGGYTIPTSVRVGWYLGTPRFESEGEFFRATVDSATFR